MCNCGYSETGHKPCVWNGTSYTQSSNYRHGKTCSVCKSEVNYSYYLYSYGNGKEYTAIYDNEYKIADQPWRERCRKNDGTVLNCSNLGICTICKRNFSSVSHVLGVNKQTDDIYCQICNSKFGKCTQTITYDEKIPKTYTFISNIKLENGATIKDYRALDPTGRNIYISNINNSSSI